MREYSKNTNKYDRDDVIIGLGYFGLAMLVVFGIIYIAVAIDSLIGLLINPEYYAIEELLDLVKP